MTAVAHDCRGGQQEELAGGPVAAVAADVAAESPATGRRKAEAVRTWLA
jgi:hypothetical protein